MRFAANYEFILIHCCRFINGNRKKSLAFAKDFLVDEDGFGPSKLTQQIYSLPPLATRELVHILFSDLFRVSLYIIPYDGTFVNPICKNFLI